LTRTAFVFFICGVGAVPSATPPLKPSWLGPSSQVGELKSKEEVEATGWNGWEEPASGAGAADEEGDEELVDG
jgi:hypothetical protein